MSDLPTTTLLVGLAVALAEAVKWLARSIALDKKGGHSNGNGSKSAGLTANEWKQEIRTAVKDTLADTAPQRQLQLENLLEKVIDREFIKRNETLRKVIREELGARPE